MGTARANRPGSVAYQARSRRDRNLARAAGLVVSEALEPRRLLSSDGVPQDDFGFGSAFGSSVVGPEVEVFGNNSIIADNDLTPSASNHTSFDSVSVGSPVTRTFLVRNIGDSVLTTSGLTVPPGFTVTEGLSTSIAPGTQDTFTVRMDATMVGAYTGQVSFENNDANEDPYNFAVLGFVNIASSQIAKLKPTDGAAGDEFGFSGAISGNIALVGNRWDDDNGSNSGSAYIFNVTTGQQIAKLLPNDGAAGDVFGFSAAISGNTGLVGTPGDDDNGTDAGSVYLFDITKGTQIAKLKPTDGAAGDFFGYSVAISGNIALVGSSQDDDNGSNSGSVYVFDVTTGTQIAKLKPADGAAGDQFGFSVAITGSTALVGSHLDDDNGTDSGSAYIFDITTGQQIAKLNPTDGAAFDAFGRSVAISGNTAVIGSHLDDDSGSAYLFDITTGSQIAKLLPSDGSTNDWFGSSVAISGNTALVGSRWDDDNGTDSGSAYLFDIATGTEIAKLKPNDGAASDRFGFSVAISGNAVLVGSYWDDDNGSNSGSAYLFRFGVPSKLEVLGNNTVIVDGDTTPSTTDRTDFGDTFVDFPRTQTFTVRNTGTIALNTSNLAVPAGFTVVEGLSSTIPVGASDSFTVRLDADVVGVYSGMLSFTTEDFIQNQYNFVIRGSVETLWSHNRKLQANDGAAEDGFGFSVAISGSIALIGSYLDDDNGLNSGSAYLYDITTGQQIAKLKPNDGAASDFFGTSVAIGGNIALVGSSQDDDNGADSGSAYLFNITTGQQIAKLKPNDGAAGDQFGSSVAISGNIALVGSLFDDDNGTNSGSAYLFDITTGQQIAKLKPTDGAASDLFGISVAISGNIALVGSYLDDDNGTDSGSVYLFNITTGQQIAKLKPTDGAASDQFGWSVAISGNTVLVGSRWDDDNGFNSGSAYLFDIITGQQIAKLKPSDGAADDVFGISVAMSGNTALVGSVLDDDNGSSSGSAYLFDIQTGQQIAKLKPTDGAAGDRFGYSVAFSGNTALVGSYWDDDNGPNSGSAYLFNLTPGPEVEVRGNNVVIKDNNATADFSDHTDFGAVQLNSTFTRTFTVRNTGSAPLATSGLTVSGNFTITEGLDAIIPVGGEDTFTVQLVSKSLGTFTGQISFTNNDIDEDHYNFVISGVVINPEVEVRGNDLVISDNDTTPSDADHTDFGSVEFGSPLTRTFTVRNTGTTALIASGLSVPTGFSVIKGLSSSIAPGEQDTFTVRLNATSLGTFSGQISFVNNDFDENPYNFAIRGFVFGSEVEVRGNNFVISDNDTTPSLSDHTDFGIVNVGSPLTRTFTVRNLGNGALTTSGLTVPSGFSITEGLSASIAPGEEDTFTVRLDATTVGTFAGQISFANNDFDENPYNFAISGVLIGPEVDVRGNSFVIVDGDTTPSPQDATDFGSVNFSSPLTRTFTVRNSGSAVLTTSGLTVPAGFTVTEGLSASIAPGAQDTFSVRLDATSAGTFTGQISFDNNDIDENPYNFTISGVVVDVPEVEVRGNGVIILDNDNTPSLSDHSEFGSVDIGSPLTRTFTVRNIGSIPLTTGGLTVPEGFTVTEGLSALIAPGAEDTFSVRLDARNAGTFAGQINFANNDSDENPYSFAIRGIVSIATSQIAKLKPADGAAGDVFGNSVAISGNIALIGSPYDDDDGFFSGSAYLFDITTGTQIAKLKSTDAAERHFFGTSVAISGNSALIGSTGNVSAYLFDITTGQQIAKLKPNDGATGDAFGISVAISGNTALIGSSRDDDRGPDSGSAYLFDITTGAQIAKLRPTDGAAEDFFGTSVAISGNVALVGSSWDDDNGTSSGSAYLFNITTGQQIAKLKPTDGAAFEYFGTSVAISGNAALIGSYGDDDNGSLSGSAYLFDITTGQQIAKLLPNDGKAGDRFGFSVAISGNTAIIGSCRSAIIGSSGGNQNTPAPGSAYLFDITTGRQIAKLLPNDDVLRDEYGHSVAISGNTALVGSHWDDDNGSESGSAYVFSFDIIAPQVSSSIFSVESAHQWTVTFDEPIDPASLDLTNVTATRINQTSGQATGVAASSVVWSAGNTVATFTFPTLADGDYRFAIAGGTVKDPSGNAITNEFALQNATTFVLAGDADRNRSVDFNDFVMLSSNYGQSGKLFSEGNFDYSSDGLVGFNDLVILARAYGQSLPTLRFPVGPRANLNPPFSSSFIRSRNPSVINEINGNANRPADILAE